MGIRKEIQDFGYQIRESLSGHTIKIVSNMDSIPDVAIIGCVGARDNFLFEMSEGTVELFRKTTGEDPEIVDIEGNKFIVSRGLGGGAAHYIVEQLPYYYTGKIGLWSLLGKCPEINQIITNLEKNSVQYFIVVVEDVPQTQFCGIIGLNNERFWVEEATYQGAMELLHPQFVPPHMMESPLTVVTTQTVVENVMEFVSRAPERVGFQLFDKYLSDTAFTQPAFKNLLRNKVSVFNVNEHELDRLVQLYGASCNEILNIFSKTAFFIGLGPLGGALASSRTGFLCKPCAFLKDSFPVGAGDTAFAGGLGCLLELLHDCQDAATAISQLDREEQCMILDAFNESGLVGVQIPYPSIPIRIRQKLIAEAREISENLNQYFVEIDQLKPFFEKVYGDVESMFCGNCFSRIDGNLVKEIFQGHE